tara:strand:+ start:51 stop:524 length:474 start_codon:yes stop_codon:yes gene_type:complete
VRTIVIATTIKPEVMGTVQSNVPAVTKMVGVLIQENASVVSREYPSYQETSSTVLRVTATTGCVMHCQVYAKNFERRVHEVMAAILPSMDFLTRTKTTTRDHALQMVVLLLPPTEWSSTRMQKNIVTSKGLVCVHFQSCGVARQRALAALNMKKFGH